MWRRPRTLVAALIVAGAALVPLFGDPRVTPVTHPLWAHLLLRALDASEAARTSRQASQVFSLLAWRDSLSLPAERYQQADGLSVRREAGQTVVSAASVPGEASYALAVVQPGDYLVRARAAAPGGADVAAEVAPLAGGVGAALRFAATDALDWVYGGALHLDPGAYRLQFLLGAGCSLARIEIAPPCLNPIEPPGGWRTTGVTTADDLAVTAVRLLDSEHELPPAGSPLEILPAQFLVETPADAGAPQLPAAGDRAAQGLAAGPAGLRAVATFELEQPGRYTISAFTAPGTGQRWLVDGCRKAVLCAGEGERWRPILSQQLAAGRHVLALALGAGATLRHVKIERKKDAPADYIATLERLGFSAGAAGPVTRAKALDAATFLRERRRVLLAALCGDPVVVAEAPPVLTAHTAGESGDRNTPQQPPAPPAKPVVPPVEPPIGPPVLPPQPPATPTEPFGS